MSNTFSWLTPEYSLYIREYFGVPETVPIRKGLPHRFMQGMYRYEWMHSLPIDVIAYPVTPKVVEYTTELREYEAVLFMFPVTTRHGVNFDMYMRIAYDTAMKEIVYTREWNR